MKSNLLSILAEKFPRANAEQNPLVMQLLTPEEMSSVSGGDYTMAGYSQGSYSMGGYSQGGYSMGGYSMGSGGKKPPTPGGG
ncbi:hypothetical protein ABAC460_04275 [Asticcacaulis sp. AC460]|uniref:hypothetical protein n=1 Tax=Asticcacaulis sp. AC460 TaxID=1282360 RepID=UPI0003C3DA70|nr:hypothetical protein [Asticcacaulis sp. AC460]ESQ92108.1 hypothetical protein ABAC460_04275 [Asticcacaulis sp. AC460]